MQTHTIKKIKSSGRRMVSFTPQYMKLLKESHCDSVAMIENYLLIYLKNHTGVDHFINGNQSSELTEHFQQEFNKPLGIKNKYNFSIRMHFINGFLGSPSIDLVDDLELLNVFFRHIEKI